MTKYTNSKYYKKIKIDQVEYNLIDIKFASKKHGIELDKLPYSLRILLENTLRNSENIEKEIIAFKNWQKNKTSKDEINYMPARVLMQDFTGVPAIVDLASMRDASKKLGKNPQKINPIIPVDLVIDHSIQVDSFGSANSLDKNIKKEMERNKERYQFLKWGQQSFSNFRVVPPGTGICHQVNLEYLAKTIYVDEGNNLYPDTLVGTDSHTTMANALSVLGWGVGGIEAEAAMLGQPLAMILPDVVGVELSGKLKDLITATDLILTITEILRKKGVVGKFVEFFGSGLDSLSLADRATISNMAPEYGATCGFFPIDSETIKYLKLTARSDHHIKIVEEYAKAQNLWRSNIAPEYTDIVSIDMNSITTSLAGPKRPQDRVELGNMTNVFLQEFPNIKNDISKKHKVDGKYSIDHGDIVLAAITSCTNTSNPFVMIAAGLVAKKAYELGLNSKPWVKTSLAPGSKVVSEYLDVSGLSEYLDKIGFNIVGYGCTSCIGNSGPLTPGIEAVIKENNLVMCSVISGNRNFEGRVHPSVKANYLASPPLVVAYALAGTVNINLEKDPIGKSKDGNDVYLKDIWPNRNDIEKYINKSINSEMFYAKYADIFEGDQNWQNLPTSKSDIYDWDKNSTYIQNPPYFDDIEKEQQSISNINNARILALFGDSITTDHISPAGSISPNSPAAKFLKEQGVEVADFNSYGARRGNHEVMMRGTFANIRIKNQICPGTEGGVTKNYINGQETSIYDAAMDYKNNNIPLVIFAGKEYGTGSSRDWAAKGTKLLGVKAVIAESFERIHRSNLVGMGVLPLIFKDKTTLKDLNLCGEEKITISGLSSSITPYQQLECKIEYPDGKSKTIPLILQAYTDKEITYLLNGGILQSVL